MKKKLITAFVLTIAAVFLTAGSGIWSEINTVNAAEENNVPPYTVNASAKTVPSGTRVNFSIGGAGCPCRGAKVGTASRGGTATASFTVNCNPGMTKACVINALAVSGGTNYKGSKKPTLSSSGIYLADITMSTY